MKIGEIVSASVLGGLTTKLELENPEDLRIGYPVIVEGRQYDFFCLVHDIVNETSDIAERLAGSRLRDSIMPAGYQEGYGGPIFYSKALLKPIQLIDKEDGHLSEPETIPPYFSETRHAMEKDVELIYQRTSGSAPLGTIRGVSKFYVHIDFQTLTEKPFAIFGRTGMGKSILNKLVCSCILARGAGSVIIFDMHGEYGVYSRTDRTEGLKFFFPERVEILSLDPKNREARPFLVDPGEIRPEDLIVALQDLNQNMIDAIYEIDRHRRSDLISAIRQALPEEYDETKVHPTVLNALKRRMMRLQRLPFIRPTGKDVFSTIIGLIRAGKSLVLDFGDFGTDQMVYLFVANVLARRLFDLYTERNQEFPRLILFLEEAHKFLDPGIATYTIFSKLARETRKFNLILALVDQRPSKIDDEVRSQLANRLVMSLKEPSDVTSALAGVPDRSMWENIISTIPARCVAVLGDAIRIPTVIDVMHYDDMNVREHILQDGATHQALEQIAAKADEVL
ncbi:MAG: ATP-binding protein [Candidatus Thermoplasmatota archaeon]|nr:ATP-binding protein [Candidatus Thermoplasmatota archaeon]